MRTGGGVGAACDGGEDYGPEVEELELGTASAVVALSVVGCIPYTSCNGGAFGGEHVTEFLVVGFYLRPPQAPAVRAAAQSAGVVLTNDPTGGVYVVTNDPQAMVAFAVKLGGLES